MNCNIFLHVIVGVMAGKKEKICWETFFCPLKVCCFDKSVHFYFLCFHLKTLVMLQILHRMA